MTGGRGSRKRPPTAKSGADNPNPFVAAVQSIMAESGGLLDLMVVRPVDLPFVVAEATAGNPDAIMLLIALEDTVKRIEAAPRRSPMLCASCPRPLLAKTLYSFAVVLPSRANPTNGLALAVCAKCATTPEQIREKAVAALRKVWPDLGARPIAVTHPTGGRA